MGLNFAAAAEKDEAAAEVVARLVETIRRTPLWRSDRLWTLEEWRMCGACAQEFQAATGAERKAAVQGYQDWLRDTRAGLTRDGTAYQPSQIHLLLRVCYRVEKNARKVAKDKDEMYPLACKEGTLEMIGLVTGGTGIYLPTVDFKVIHARCTLRDLSQAKVKLEDGRVVPLLR
ncbi:hypothetical protein [Prosthecobacter sp.]|uniref:hypothetical protein n=1 Tax=Prosthecobacter sp. TaxID=1965333 RepID=UPI003783B284